MLNRRAVPIFVTGRLAVSVLTPRFADSTRSRFSSRPRFQLL